MTGDAGVISLAEDGTISTWTQNNQDHWQWTKILEAGSEETACFAYTQDRIAVAVPRFGVKVWLWIKGTWQPQRSILRQNVTSIKFVEDGEALLGGTSDGVLWYCQVPNGTLRAYTFLKSKVHSIDVISAGSQALVSQIGGRSHLVGITQDDHKGKIEQVYAIKEGDLPLRSCHDFGAIFASRGRTVLFGSMDGYVLIWDKSKGEIIRGLDHGEDEIVQAIASYDRSSHIDDCYLVTGTKRGLLTWWRPPLIDAQSQESGRKGLLVSPYAGKAR
ncbi:hypothetical protein SERLA73DRAFT_185932 [Serpula lacrymans var. lacrymans S7.3]|uniref:Anaphase-promoting complex subunit 4 WD40 domain-containing protein n=1 Tax=Serpula lacrymans var. lacrymans (strain S7.3) TaxID=936435 RepID=F8Q6N4_SERL3|nr:hypothetical protein SERLA73DRAFT_185932 [Serpula lacrymans var. lacrymans S7.3]